MSDLPRRFLDLSPKTRALLELMLREEGVSSPSTRQIPRRAETGPAPLSFSQERLWFLDQLEPGLPTFNIPKALRLQGALDVPALQQSISEIVRRHEVLRTTFP